MAEQKQSKVPSFKSMLNKSSRGKPSIEKSSLTGVRSSGGAGGVGKGQADDKPVNPTTASGRPIQGVETRAMAQASAPPEKITDYVLGPLQMHCLREFAAGRCDRLEITPAYKVPFIDGVSLGPSNKNRARPAVMRCERRIYSRETGAFAYASLKLIGEDLRASRCSAIVERDFGFRYEDEDFGEF